MIMKKQKNPKTQVGIFNTMGGYLQGGNFLGGSFSEGNSSGGRLMGRNFSGRSFPDTIVFNIFHLFTRKSCFIKFC